jgi:hypothetical protein
MSGARTWVMGSQRSENHDCGRNREDAAFHLTPLLGNPAHKSSIRCENTAAGKSDDTWIEIRRHTRAEGCYVSTAIKSGLRSTFPGDRDENAFLSCADVLLHLTAFGEDVKVYAAAAVKSPFVKAGGGLPEGNGHSVVFVFDTRERPSRSFVRIRRLRSWSRRRP